MKTSFGVFIGYQLAAVRLMLTDNQFKRYCEIIGMPRHRAIQYIDFYFKWQMVNAGVIPTGVE